MAQNYGALIGELVSALQSNLSAYAPTRLNVAPPQLKTASAVDQLLGTNFNRSRQSIFDELASVINTAYATSMDEQRDNERAYLQALANVSDTATDTLRNQYAADAAAGANVGMQAANALSAILGMQNNSITGVNELFGNRSTLVNQKANDLAGASKDATDLYNTLQQYLADFSKSLYETDSTIYTTELASWNAYIDAIMGALPYLTDYEDGYGGGYYGGDYYGGDYYGDYGSVYNTDVPTLSSTVYQPDLLKSPLRSAAPYTLTSDALKALLREDAKNQRPAALQYNNPFTNATNVANGVGKTGVGSLQGGTPTGNNALANGVKAAMLGLRLANPAAAYAIMNDDDDVTKSKRSANTALGRKGVNGGVASAVLGAKKVAASNAAKATTKASSASNVASQKIAAQKVAAQAAAKLASQAALQKASAQSAAQNLAAQTAAQKAATQLAAQPAAQKIVAQATAQKAAAQAAAAKASAAKKTTNTTASSMKSNSGSVGARKTTTNTTAAAKKTNTAIGAAAAAAAAAKAVAAKASAAKKTTNTKASSKKAANSATKKTTYSAGGINKRMTR